MPRRPRNVPLTDTERGVEHGYGDEKPKLTNHLQNVADMYGRLAEHTMVIAEAEAWVPTTTNTREVPERDYLLDALSARDASRQVRIAELRTLTLTTVLPGSMCTLGQCTLAAALPGPPPPCLILASLGLGLGLGLGSRARVRVRVT